MKIISVDYECSAETWWAVAQTDDAAPVALAPMLADLRDDIAVTDDEAEAIRAWAEALPGWHDGPEHAPTPLTFRDR